MPYLTNYTSEEKRDMVRRATLGCWTAKEFAAWAHVGETTINRWVKTYGGTLRKMRRPNPVVPLTMEDRKKIATDLRSAKEVAKAYGVGLSTVYQMRKAFEVEHKHVRATPPTALIQALKYVKEGKSQTDAAWLTHISPATLRKALRARHAKN